MQLMNKQMHFSPFWVKVNIRGNLLTSGRESTNVFTILNSPDPCHNLFCQILMDSLSYRTSCLSSSLVTVRHLGKMNILSWRSLRKWQKQEGQSDLWPLPCPSTYFSPKWLIKLACERYSPCTRRQGEILTIRDGGFGVKKSVQICTVKPC